MSFRPRSSSSSVVVRAVTEKTGNSATDLLRPPSGRLAAVLAVGAQSFSHPVVSTDVAFPGRSRARVAPSGAERLADELERKRI